jgi:hypothetical protein
MNVFCIVAKIHFPKLSLNFSTDREKNGKKMEKRRGKGREHREGLPAVQQRKGRGLQQQPSGRQH